MKQKLILLTFLLIALSAFSAEYYVDASRLDDSGDGTSWATAKQTIQAAIDLTSDGDTVVVTNGIYNTGSTVMPGYSLPNRVVATNAIIIRSVNGPAETIIQGQGPIGANAVRGVYLSGGAQLAGFTVENGASASSGNPLDNRGGGLYSHSGSVVSNCVIRNNSAIEGGGIYLHLSGNLLCNSLIECNGAVAGGGVAFGDAGASVARNCRIVGNRSANKAGGVFLYHSGTLKNCLIADNSATNSAGGVCVDWGVGGPGGGGDAYILNCTIAGNEAPSFSGYSYIIAGARVRNSIIQGNWGWEPEYWDNGSSFEYSVAIPLPSGVGNTTNDPLFADSSCRLSAGSPCIDAGNNGYVSTTADLDGNPRIINDAVDMGAYELFVNRLLLTVASAYGSAAPVAGSHYYAEGTVVTCAVQSVVLADGTNYTCVGWTGTGSVPETGSNNQTEAILLAATNSSITWIWQPSGDLDSDGIPDTWEYRYYGHATGAVATADDDNDGYTNYQEYRFGTDPTDPQSRFSFSCQISPEKKIAAIIFDTSIGRIYTIESRASLVSGPWDPYISLYGNGGAENIKVYIQGPGRYFRVTVEMDEW